MIFVLPNQSAKSLSAGIEQSPDTSIFYTSQTLYQLAEDYGQEGRDFYVTQRFTFDLIFPLVYGLFFISTIGFLSYRIKANKYKYLIYLPIISVIFDYLENISTSITMYRYPKLTPFISDIAGFMTLFKWSILSLSILVLPFLITLYIHQLRKNKKEMVNQ
jgi:hypothetical protein